MDTAFTFGHLTEYAMTFQMSNTAGRGFWWGHSSMSDAQGAMSLDVTTGNLTTAGSIRAGYGTSDTTQHDSDLDLDVSGLAKAKAFKEGRFTTGATTLALDPANGGSQTWNLTANSTATDSLADGESILLHISDGATYSVTWPAGIGWMDNVPPSLPSNGYAAVVIWKMGTQLYGNYLGQVGI
jgi:hypothetical protein